MSDWSRAALIEMTNHSAPPQSGTWARELAEQQMPQTERVYMSWLPRPGELSKSDLRDWNKLMNLGDYVSADAILDAARARARAAKFMADRRAARRAAKFTRRLKPATAAITPQAAEGGVGEGLAQGRIDTQRKLSYGGSRPNSVAVAKDLGLSVNQVDGRSPGHFPVSPDNAATPKYMQYMHLGDLEKIVPRKRGESDPVYRKRATLETLESQNAELRDRALKKA